MFVNKLGTVMNTVGSLGLGYYGGTTGLFTGSFPGFDLMSHYPLYISCIILAVGLGLRVANIVERDAELKKYQANAQHFQHESSEFEHRLDDMNDSFDAAVDRSILKKLRPMVRDEITKIIGHPVEHPNVSVPPPPPKL